MLLENIGDGLVVSAMLLCYEYINILIFILIILFIIFLNTDTDENY